MDLDANDLTPAQDLEDLREANGELLRSLGQRGISVLPLDLLKLRLDMFTDFVFGAFGEEARLKFELAWEREVNERLTNAISQSTRAELLRGVGGQ